MSETNIYQENGFDGREAYLDHLAAEYNVSLTDVVLPLAHLFGPEEDFDGLVTSLQDKDYFIDN